MEQPPERHPACLNVRTRTRAPGMGDLARQIEIEYRAAHDAAHSVVEHTLACGRLLIEAKARVGHGNWLTWVGAHLSFGERMARKYMRVYEHRDQIGIENADLTIDGALALLAEPRATPAAPSTPALTARAPAPPAPSPRTRPPARAPVSAPEPEPDHIARLQSALAMIADLIADLPEPPVLAENILRRRRADTLLPSVEQVSQYLNLLGIALDRGRDPPS